MDPINTSKLFCSVTEHFSIPENLPQLRSDLAPLYDLKPADYNRIVNELTNLLVTAIHLIKESGNPSLAQTIIDYAAELLRDYDDDVAEFVETYSARTHTSPTEPTDCI